MCLNGLESTTDTINVDRYFPTSGVYTNNYVLYSRKFSWGPRIIRILALAVPQLVPS